MFKNKIQLDPLKCSLCQTCILICPQEAFSFIHQGDKGKIILNHSCCKYPCQVCAAKCPNNALKVTKRWFFTYFPPREESWAVNYDKCKECGTFLEPGEEKLCSHCRRKSASRKQQKNNAIFQAGNQLGR